MSRINASLKIINSAKDIEKQILLALQEELTVRLRAAGRNLQNKLRKILSNAITSTPEYQSLLGGQLQSELGVTNSRSRLSKIIDTFVNNVEIHINNIRIQNHSISGGLDINVVKYDYGEILSLPESRYVTDKGVVIEWLQWLLLEGDKIIVRKYHIAHSKRRNNSRTGLGEIMVSGGRWRVPPEFSGKRDDNFITRAVENAMNDIENAVKYELFNTGF